VSLGVLASRGVDGDVEWIDLNMVSSHGSGTVITAVGTNCVAP
jgi:hypothetical protein